MAKMFKELTKTANKESNNKDIISCVDMIEDAIDESIEMGKFQEDSKNRITVDWNFVCTGDESKDLRFRNTETVRGIAERRYLKAGWKNVKITWSDRDPPSALSGFEYYGKAILGKPE